MVESRTLLARQYAIRGLEEDRVWNDLRENLDPIPENVREIVAHGMLEMSNNAIEHSGGTTVSIRATRTGQKLSIQIGDDGCGIFQHLIEVGELADTEQAAIELAKGRFTTRPQDHTGEGIFFCSRAFDRFWILSDGFFLILGDSGSASAKPADATSDFATLVDLTIAVDSNRQLSDVYEKYAPTPECQFSRTEIPIHLLVTNGDYPMSRSQARRVVHRLERFGGATFDFANVDAIGQAFADEIFRVFAGKHPEVELRYINASDRVDYMIRRAIANRRDND